MSKALIEKAFEKWKNDSGCRNNSCNDCQGGCEGAFIAGATWQREQYKNTTEYFTANYCEQLLEENKLLKERFKKYQADNLLEREQLIKELREWIVINRLISYDTTDTERLLAKLDLLEKDK